MNRKALSLAAGSLLLALTAGCSMSSPDPLAQATLDHDVKVTILQTTDMHDHAAGVGAMAYGSPGAVGSYARVAAYVNSVRTANTAEGSHDTVLVDSGDWTMGTLYDLTIGSQPMATFFLDTLRYDCAALGNHEFDYTPKGLASMLAVSQGTFGFHTPLVASNLVLNGNTDLAPYLGTSIHTTYTKTYGDGLKVGFIGLMGKDAASAAPASAPVTFTDYSQNYASVQSLVDGLRGQGCHLVVALSHAGTDKTTGGYSGEDIDLAKHVTGIDVIASGHTHNPFADASAAHAVSNGGWTTQVVCAGAYTQNVARIDLTYHVAAKNCTVLSASNKTMTDATLAGLPGAPTADGAQTVFLQQADQKLNIGLAPLFSQFFPDFATADPSKGVYHPVGLADQDMVSNDQAVPMPPNGLGNLCADAVRNVPNGLIMKALFANGWNGVNGDPSMLTAAGALIGRGYDPTTYSAAVVPTGVIRDPLTGNTPISFANAYNVLPLGISPDTSQSIPIGYPLMSVYLSYADLKTLCALQLIAQSGLVPSDYYLNLSGLTYSLDTNGSYDYFKYATAAAVLQVTQQKAVAGSTAAVQALTALGSLATDSGSALLGLYGTNPYAQAMINLNDVTPDANHMMVNLQALGTVAGAAQTSKLALYQLIVTKAIDAVAEVQSFSPTDAACTGGTSAMDTAQRYRVAGNLYSILMMGALQANYGVTVTPFARATGGEIVSAANLTAAMAYRISLAYPTQGAPTPAVQELKEWMCLVTYLITPPTNGGHFTSGHVTSEYASTSNFLQFGSFGDAVRTRSASYPIASVGQLMATLQALGAAS